jgi:RNA recognition motif-containing protein
MAIASHYMEKQTNMFQMQHLLGPKKKFDNSVCLIVNNLSNTTFENDLFKHFSSKGYKMANVKVIQDQVTMRSKGFGYLNFHS